MSETLLLTLGLLLNG